jgi:hypothetical protein
LIDPMIFYVKEAGSFANFPNLLGYFLLLIVCFIFYE